MGHERRLIGAQFFTNTAIEFPRFVSALDVLNHDCSGVENAQTSATGVGVDGGADDELMFSTNVHREGALFVEVPFPITSVYWAATFGSHFHFVVIVFFAF